MAIWITRNESLTTTQPYRAVLERLWILDEARAWLPSRNRLLRLLQAPKHHLADPALAVRLLGMDAQALLTKSTSSSPVPADGTLLGNLFESLVALCLRVYAQRSETRVFHFRQHSGRREVDYILERPDGRIVAVEVKLSSAIKQEDVRNLLWLREQLGDDLIQAVVIHTGPTAYRRKDGVAVVPASLLSP